MQRILVAIAATVFAALAAAQQPFPSRSVTLVSPFPPGGSTDAVARVMAQRMAQSLGHPVVVENTSGAGGSIGAGRVARATPDGYTIHLGQWDNLSPTASSTRSTTTCRRDFEPIGLLSIIRSCSRAQGLPADDLRELVAWMKANPGKATFAVQQAPAPDGRHAPPQLTGTTSSSCPTAAADPRCRTSSRGTSTCSSSRRRRVAAGARRNDQGVRAPVAPTPLGGRRRHSHRRTRRACPASIPRMVRALRAEGHAAEVVAKLNAAMVEALADPAVRKRSPTSGWTSRRASSRRPRGSPPSTRPRSRSGGRSSRRPASKPNNKTIEEHTPC